MPQLLEIGIHFLTRLGELAFEISDFILHCLKIDLGLGLEGVDVARDIEIESFASISAKVALWE